MFEFFVARRYLRAKRKQVVISVITAISVIGVAAGVMSLVIALAINNGFSSTLQRNLLGATAHVSILEKERGTGISGWEEIAAKLAKIPHVISSAPGLYDGAYLYGIGQGSGVIVKGVSVAPGSPVPDALLHPKLGGGVDALRAAMNMPSELPGIILGARLAESVGTSVDKQVQILIPNGELTPFGPRPSFHRLRVVGIFESGFFDLDNNWGFAALPVAQKLFGLENVVNSIELRLDDIYKANEVARAAEPIIGPAFAATTWGEQNRQLLNALKTERIVTVITIGLIQIVAALNILIALIMMVMEKHRDIAILISLGARAAQIRRIFVFEGALIGSVGTVLGLIAGYTLCYFAGHYRWIRLDEQVYALSFVPFEPRALDGVWIAATAMVISLVATLYPARNATRILPAEALRYE
jgi:lipoprotein-releasing system permease protein